MLVRFITSLTVLLSGAPAFADYAIFDTGEIVKPKTYKLTANSQHLTESGGMNITARIDTGLTEEFGVRGFLGTGKTDVFVGAMAKWMPFPDTDSQPAMGVAAGIHYIKDGDLRDMVVRLEPMISKRVEVGTAVLTPYGSVPVSIISREVNEESDDEVGTQFVVGSQLQLDKWKNLQFMAELGVELNEAPSYFGVGAIFYWDPAVGFKLEPGAAPAQPDDSDDDDQHLKTTTDTEE